MFTSFAPTFTEIDLGVRLYPIRFLGLGFAGGIGIGGGPGIDGALRFPEIRVSAGFVPPVRNVLLQLGGELVMVDSRQDDRDVVDPGGTFFAELRAPLPGSPLYLGGGFAVGHVVGPYLAGRLAIGIVLVEHGGAP